MGCALKSFSLLHKAEVLLGMKQGSLPRLHTWGNTQAPTATPPQGRQA